MTRRWQAAWLALSLGTLLAPVGAAEVLDAHGISAGWGRRTGDPRQVAPGLLVPKVPPDGPDEPYAALLMELDGAATALFLEDGAGQLWRIEIPRRLRGRRHTFDQLAVSLEPGTYDWVGFMRWHRRADGRHDIYEALDVPRVRLEVRPGVVSYGGLVQTRLRQLPRVHRAVKRWGRVHVNPADFQVQFRVSPPNPRDLVRLARTWPWIRRNGLRVVSALRAGAGRPLPRGAFSDGTSTRRPHDGLASDPGAERPDGVGKAAVSPAEHGPRRAWGVRPGKPASP